MKDKENIPESELFTSKIEETIDDLFKPTKQIEIDPLTQEVKEVASEEAGATEPQIELELAIDEGPEESSESKESQKPTASEAEDAEPEIELELVDEVDTEPEKPVGEEQLLEDKVHDRLQKLLQAVYTIEWEVSGKELSKTQQEIENLLNDSEIQKDDRVRSLLSMSARVLEQGKNKPQQMKATAPSVLKKAVETVIAVLEGKAPENIEEVKEQLKGLMGEGTDASHDIQLEPVEDQIAEEVVPSANKTNKDLEAVKEKAPTSVRKPSEFDLKAQEILKAHLIELQKQVNKIIPLERLLSKTTGMEKLHKFHTGVRTSLEKEIERISQFFFEPGTLNLPKAEASISKKEDYVSDVSGDKCPWKKLLTLSIEGTEVGFVAEEVAYISQPPFLSKSFIKKTDSLPLKKLRPWPWSKLKGLFDGKLAEMDEKTIEALEFPVLRSIVGHKSPASSNFYVVVIFDGITGAVLRVPERPLAINVPEDAKFYPINRGQRAGILEINDTKVSVITVESLNR